MQVKTARADHANLAAALAQLAHQHLFPTRRGVIQLDHEEGLVAVYNNNPYDAGPQFRRDETERIREQLAALKIEEVAYATHGGDDRSYTYALLLRGIVTEGGKDDVFFAPGHLRELIRQETAATTEAIAKRRNK
jgi:hypothetical protein